jgi:hypothetical protein
LARMSIGIFMAITEKQPWWERPGPSPSAPEFDPEREHLRAELARSWQARLDERRERRAHRAVTDSPEPPTAA